MDIGAVRDGIRVAEAPGETLVERNIDDLLAADPVEHEQVLDEHGFLLHQRAHAEGVERVPGVGRDLDAGADLAELRRLLKHHRAEALARERQRRGQAADAAAGDDHRPLVTSLVSHLHCSMVSAARPSGERGSASVSTISKWLRPLPMIAGAPSFSANACDWR